MKWETRLALLESIEHWKENEQKARIGNLWPRDIKSMGCSLCKRFYMDCSEPMTKERCPIALDGFFLCDFATWKAVSDKVFKGDTSPVKECRAMRNYLASLI